MCGRLVWLLFINVLKALSAVLANIIAFFDVEINQGVSAIIRASNNFLVGLNGAVWHDYSPMKKRAYVVEVWLCVKFQCSDEQSIDFDLTQPQAYLWFAHA